jgi:hypothetical protein
MSRLKIELSNIGTQVMGVAAWGNDGDELQCIQEQSPLSSGNENILTRLK